LICAQAGGGGRDEGGKAFCLVQAIAEAGREGGGRVDKWKQ